MKRINPDRLKYWSGLRRPYLGLSQTCSKIRREFLPVYSTVPTGVDLGDLNDYLRIFVVQRGGGVADYRGNIDIGVVEDNDCDIRDALILLNKSSYVSAGFSTRELEEDFDLGADGCEVELESVLLDSAFYYPKFWDFLLTKTSSVALDTMAEREFCDMDGMPLRSDYVSGMEICVKTEFAEDWMCKEFNWAGDDWLSEFGLPKNLFIYFTVQGKN